MKRKSADYAAMGLNALKRAAQKAFQRARQDNLQIPVWRNGKIEFITSELEIEQKGVPDCQPTVPLSGK